MGRSSYFSLTSFPSIHRIAYCTSSNKRTEPSTVQVCFEPNLNRSSRTLTWPEGRSNAPVPISHFGACKQQPDLVYFVFYIATVRCTSFVSGGVHMCTVPGKSGVITNHVHSGFVLACRIVGNATARLWQWERRLAIGKISQT